MCASDIRVARERRYRERPRRLSSRIIKIKQARKLKNRSKTKRASGAPESPVISVKTSRSKTRQRKKRSKRNDAPDPNAARRAKNRASQNRRKRRKLKQKANGEKPLLVNDEPPEFVPPVPRREPPVQHTAPRGHPVLTVPSGGVYRPPSVSFAVIVPVGSPVHAICSSFCFHTTPPIDSSGLLSL
jgi:hypothetical protein